MVVVVGGLVGSPTASLTSLFKIPHKNKTNALPYIATMVYSK